MPFRLGITLLTRLRTDETWDYFTDKTRDSFIEDTWDSLTDETQDNHAKYQYARHETLRMMER